MGRVNYGHKLTAPTQSKGLGRGAMADLHFIGNWKIYPLPLESVSALDYSKTWQENQPAFYRYIPKGYLKKGENEIVVFETEGKYRERLPFSQEPIYKYLK